MGVSSLKTEKMNPLPSLRDPESCCGCSACVDACPVHALHTVVNGDGFFTSALDEQKCIGCGKCAQVCPVLAPPSAGEKDCLSQVYGGWCINEEIRKRGATSGIFGGLAHKVLEEGGVVFGAVQDGFVTHHEKCSELADLPKMQGSKYQSSDMTGIYRQVLDALNSGKKVLFSGLPCQVAALKQFLGNKVDSENLYAVDLICGGVPSQLLFALYRTLHPDVVGIRSFRDKKNGWKPIGYQYNLEVEKMDGTRECRGSENILIRGFSSHLFLRDACHSCRFATISHDSDVTIGDLWGDKQFPEEHAQGVSAVVVHTKKGKELLKMQPEIQLTPVDWTSFLTYNPRYWKELSILEPFKFERRTGRSLLHLSLRKKRDCLSLFLNSVFFILKVRFRLFAKGTLMRNIEIMNRWARSVCK